MSENNLQQELLNREVQPPSNAWEKIAFALDELEADEPLQKKILEIKLTPPLSAWNEINQRLNENISAQELLQSKVEVPENIWNRINEQLDKAADERIAERLYDASVTAPASAWKTIEAELNNKESAKIIPFQPGYKRLVQYAAAAAITGLLAWGAYQLFNQNNRETNSAIASADTGNKDSQQQKQTNLIQPEAIAETEAKNVEKEASSTKTKIRKRVKEALQTGEAIVLSDVKNHSSNSAVSAKTIHHKKPETSKSNFSESQYFILLNDNGDLVRVTKRINNLKCVKADDIPVDAAAALNSRDCNDQIKKWQEKMALSTSLATSAGMIDITEVIKTTDR